MVCILFVAVLVVVVTEGPWTAAKGGGGQSNPQPINTEDHWDRPEPSIAFLRSAGLLDQS